MIILPKSTDLKNSLKKIAAKNKWELLGIGYFALLQLSFLGGNYLAFARQPKPEPLKPLLGYVEQEITVAPTVVGAETAEDEPETQERTNTPQTHWSPPPPPSHSATFSTWGTPNNKFGMYINADPGQIREVAPLINSNGGAWGWVLVPMAINQRDGVLWQAIFDTSRAHHVKPLIQLYNNETCDVNTMDFKGLAEFFNSLSWPTKHLYISIFNEVNALYYWCGRSAPEEYAQVLNTAIDAFKSVNPNFFLMPAGLNSSARSGPRYLDEEDYLLRMNAAVPGIFKKIDGWATHAYPQPEFSGDFYNPPSWYGVRDQIENYKWEMGLLQRHFGVSGLPIFITETGWAHSEGHLTKWQYKHSSITARYFDDAYRNHWLPNNQIVAIMPFVWHNPDAPNFNWRRDDGTFYPQYDVVMRFPKVAGTDD